MNSCGICIMTQQRYLSGATNGIFHLTVNADISIKTIYVQYTKNDLADAELITLLNVRNMIYGMTPWFPPPKSSENI